MAHLCAHCQTWYVRIAHAISLAFMISMIGVPSRAADPELDVPAEISPASHFQNVVLPILKQRCFECHSHAAEATKGGLVLDSRSGWQIGGDSGPAIVPGEPDESLLMAAVRHDGLEMPPSGKLPAEQIEHLRRWVASGAFDPRQNSFASDAHDDSIDFAAGRLHWAFQPLPTGDNVPLVPHVAQANWPSCAIDRFVLARLESHGVQSVGDADPSTWLRRVYFDLTGLPPTIGEVREFLADRSPLARGTVVDRLLNSSAFGERWARHWLDLVGYADQIGTSNNVFAEHAWRYRNYVIDAFNHDKPFDVFLKQQLAGDLLGDATPTEQAAAIVATGFLVLGDIEIVEADKAKLLVDIVDQQVKKVGKAFLGMTIDCARCHDHKFDPISQRDYYAIGGFFHNTSSIFKTDRGVWSDVNVVELPETDAERQARERRQREHETQLVSWNAELAAAQITAAELAAQLDMQDLTPADRERLSHERDQANERIGHLNRLIEHATFFAPTIPRAHGVRDVGEPTEMRITIRGNPRALGDAVPRGFLSVMANGHAEIPAAESGRVQLAEWLVAPPNPLTARVAVNRIWQKLFGEGLVRSVDNFGLTGERPSHPELLDYLAGRFVRDGWSQKRLIRSLVLSRTYQLDSASNAQAQAIDPDNRLLWRMNRLRLDSAALRDALIFVSGRLQPPSAGPAIPLEYLENVGGLDPADVNPPSFRLSKWRPGQEFERSIYLPVIRHGGQPAPAELRNVFDFPQPSQFTGQRSITAVPTQALFLMNSSVVKGHAAALAARLQVAAVEDQNRIECLWLTLFARGATNDERDEARRFLVVAGDDGWTELCHALLASNEFLMRL